VRALLHTGEQAGLGLPVLRAVEAVNHGQKRLLVDKIVARFGEDLTGCRFALWGLAFKPGTDDMREAPSLVVMRELIDRGALVVAYDPVALAEARARTAQWHRVEFATSAAEAVKGADALVIVTEWKEFRSPDFDALRADLKQPLIFDGRNLFDPQYLTGLGFDYRCVGRAAVQAAGDPR
jgi:UDPglucose 6-dehydrogenase